MFKILLDLFIIIKLYIFLSTVPILKKINKTTILSIIFQIFLPEANVVKLTTAAGPNSTVFSRT